MVSSVASVCLLLVVIGAPSVTSHHGGCHQDPVLYTCPFSTTLKITFSGANTSQGSKVRVDTCGNHYQKSLFSTLESVTYSQAVQSHTYTLALTDPDAPGHGEGEAWLHWIHIGLKGSDLAEGRLRGTDLMSYRPPTPPPRTGTHRYALFVFREEGPQRDTTMGNGDRGHFKLLDYAKRNGLCGPLAMNMFTTEN